MVDKVSFLHLRDEEFYNVNDHPGDVLDKIQKSLAQLTKINRELDHHNDLENFFTMKPTTISRLEMLIVEY